MSVQAMSASGTAHASAGRLRRFWDSSVGKKIVMAATGIVGIGFVIGHMAGNLQMFKPTGAPQAMHDYAVLLRKLGALLWVARAVLLGAVVLHAVAAYQLTMRARAARPVAYGRRKPQVSTWSSRTMRVGGFLLLAFIVFHILDMTWGVGMSGYRHLDPYNNLRVGLGRWWASAVYILAALGLGFHLYHGAWASLRSLGVRRASAQPLHRKLAVVIALVVTVGFAAVPVAALLGMFRDDTPVLMDQSHVAGSISTPAAQPLGTAARAPDTE